MTPTVNTLALLRRPHVNRLYWCLELLFPDKLERHTMILSVTSQFLHVFMSGRMGEGKIIIGSDPCKLLAELLSP